MTMEERKTVRVTYFRFDPTLDPEPRRPTFEVPIQGTMSVLNVLEYIQRYLDPSIAYYSCCRRGLCGKCGVKVNGTPGLACEMVVEGDMVIEPLNEKKLQRDLACY